MINKLTSWLIPWFSKPTGDVTTHLVAQDLPTNHLLSQVIYCHTRWDLRKIVKRVYSELYALRVEVAEDKTYIGHARKGFDFLGKRILPTGVLPLAAALSRRQTKTARLNEQGASKRRIVRYWVRWLGWAGLASLYLSPVAMQAADILCNPHVCSGDINDPFINQQLVFGECVFNHVNPPLPMRNTSHFPLLCSSTTSNRQSFNRQI